ncbi:protein-glucosylgalactosylhydroxylysine glucosidase-like [Ylistrum balloti]|uniref:protein-glucosylgalactosylhydroxylysine glucosidase-like n=1 Tax=Ylistrum balloti TaxID=509963 RepID=UPI002905B42D|nr:protein-glucosylgalactosylhydroxylysine glucosidase-like [Ylistrum balloti]
MTTINNWSTVILTITLASLLNGAYVSDKRVPRTVNLIHGNSRKITNEVATPYPGFLDPDVTVLSSSTRPDAKAMPSIGNGHVATVVHSDTLYVDGLYNGQNSTSHRARIRSTASINITDFSFDIDSQKFSLDVGRGMYIEEYTQNDYVKVELKMYAHQWMTWLLVTEISVINNGGPPVVLNLSQTLGPVSDDVNVNTTQENDFRIDFSMTKEGEVEGDDTEHVLAVSSLVPESITVGPSEASRYVFLTAIGDDPMIVMAYFGTGLKSFLNGTLESSHVNHWESMWRKGRIDVGGNRELSKLNYGSLYYLLSEIPQYETYGPFFGISSGGLGHGGQYNDYKGHVSWDQDTWMFPSLLALHSDKAKIIMETRVRKHSEAKALAKAVGYKGAMYPWEIAYSGGNVCPTTDCLKYEHHITGDIALALQQYVMMTRDTHFIANEGASDVITDIATFWISRMSLNTETNQYEINEVMGPDKSHFPVNNSVYTNSVAKISLLLPKYALSLINKTADPTFEETAKQTYIPFNDTGRWHPEFDGYELDTTVQQADAILLGFPLMANITDETRRNDLEIYEKVTPTAPAMTWAMFAIGWLEVNNKPKAEEQFNKQMKNIVPPFNIWSNPADSKGGRNYLSGIGGYLQSLLYGYGGLRIFQDRLQFNPNIPPSSTSFNLTGIDYLGGSFDFSFLNNSMLITQTSPSIGEIKIVITSTGETETLKVGAVVQYPRSKAYLMLV